RRQYFGIFAFLSIADVLERELRSELKLARSDENGVVCGSQSAKPIDPGAVRERWRSGGTPGCIGRGHRRRVIDVVEQIESLRGELQPRSFVDMEASRNPHIGVDGGGQRVAVLRNKDGASRGFAASGSSSAHRGSEPRRCVAGNDGRIRQARLCDLV